MVENMSSNPDEPYLYYGGWPSSFICEFHIYAPHLFYPSRTTTYSSPEHLFQAYKATNEVDFENVRRAPSPGGAKARGNQIQLRSDWNEIGESGEPICYEVMLFAQRLKFKHPSYIHQLKLTGDRILMENAIDRSGRADSIWGIRNALSRGYGWDGQNRHGLVLMQIRCELNGQQWVKAQWLERMLAAAEKLKLAERIAP